MAKIKVRFIGSADAAILSNTPDHPTINFSRYGQLIELDEGVYQDIISGKYGAKLPLLTEAEFQDLGHPPDHLTKFGSFESHVRAPQDFQDKKADANAKLLANIQAVAKPIPPVIMPVMVESPPKTDTIPAPKETV